MNTPETTYPGFFKGKHISSQICYKANNKESAKIIDRIWFTGSLSSAENSVARLNLHISFLSGNRVDFCSDDLQKTTPEDLLKEADNLIDLQIKKKQK